MQEKLFPKSILWITLTLFCAIFVLFFFIPKPKHPLTIIETDNQPTIGNPKALVHVVVFEEPKCKHCKKFTEEIYPEIKKNYIDKEKIRFTVIPVSFLPGSEPLAAALLCIHSQNNDAFFKYLHILFQSTNFENEVNLESLAKELNFNINFDKLKNCLQTHEFYSQIKSNTQYGNQLLGHLTTPSLFVDGVLVDKVSYNSISKEIERALKKREKQS